LNFGALFSKISGAKAQPSLRLADYMAPVIFVFKTRSHLATEEGREQPSTHPEKFIAT
jgi:hypothetical protein